MVLRNVLHLCPGLKEGMPFFSALQVHITDYNRYGVKLHSGEAWPIKSAHPWACPPLGTHLPTLLQAARRGPPFGPMPKCRGIAQNASFTTPRAPHLVRRALCAEPRAHGSHPTP